MSSNIDSLAGLESQGISFNSPKPSVPSVLVPPASWDRATSRTQPALDFDEQVAFYRSWLVSEITASAAGDMSEEVSAYAAEATKVYTVGQRRVTTYAPFHWAGSALRTITKGQKIALGILGLAVVLGLALNPLAVIAIITALVTQFYFGNLLVTFWLSTRGHRQASENGIPDEIVHALDDADWPTYTILCPLYKETEVVHQFAAAMQALDYPSDRLQILFLTEEDDEATRAAIRDAQLPAHFQIVTVPDGQPRTKPRACNYGLLQATGRYVVIFDAEDVPDPLQLKKAVLTFAQHGPKLGCVQAKLNFYNTNQNILTRWFTIEYSTWFDGTLPGLQWARLPLPLGGTSNHFRLETLRLVGAWDAFNVTEDCDLGLRLSRHGFKTVVLDSITREEANPAVGNWIRQRSRWIKGYMQTYLIHMRQPADYLKQNRLYDFISLNLIIGGRTGILLINPIMWFLLIAYFALRPWVEDTYHAIFPGPILYLAVLCLIFGNVMYIYTHFVGCLRRKEYSLIKWTLLIPIYWAMSSYAAYKALFQLVTRPHYWEKTKHGLHLAHPEPNGESTSHAHQAESTTTSKPAASPAKPILLMAPSTFSAAVPNGNGHARPASPAATRRPDRRSPILAFLSDRWLIATLLVASLASALSLVYFAQNNELLLFGDANAHLGIARRVFDNVNPGLAQLGGIWLSLPHLAMVPFVQVEWLWRTGLAGACVAVPSFLIAAIYLFLAARRLTQNSLASFIGTLVFILNPNVLYLQTTPLSEMVFLATMAAACYYFLAWVQDGNPFQLIPLAAATFLTTLARYDGWPLFLCFAMLIPLISWIKGQDRDRRVGNLVIFGVLGGLGLILWLLWGALIFNDPLYFQHSQFSSQAQQMAFIGENLLYTYHNLGQSIRTFLIDAGVVLGPGLFALGVIGLLVLFLRRRLSPDTLAVLTYLVPTAFYIVSLFTGQAVLFVPQAIPAGFPSQIFNTRYGVVIILPAAIFMAILANYLSQTRRLPRLSHIAQPVFRVVGQFACLAVIVGQAMLTSGAGPIVLQEGQRGMSCAAPGAIVVYLYEHYHEGKILADAFNSGVVDFLGPLDGIAFQNVIYEGSGKFWRDALIAVPPDVDWIVANPHNTRDQITQNVNPSSPAFLSQFTAVAEDTGSATGGLELYHRNSQPLVQVRSVPSKLFEAYQTCNQAKQS